MSQLRKPGDLLAEVIFQITGRRAGGCRCSRRHRQMNRWGWLGCWLRRAIILEWLAEEAQKRGHAIDRSSASLLLRAAIRETLMKKRSSGTSLRMPDAPRVP